jgi:hypothetical protein
MKKVTNCQTPTNPLFSGDHYISEFSIKKKRRAYAKNSKGM